ncbi:MAG TPA: hypothetical protein V6C96_05480, partial [Vampirovibrionales bacterium]
FKEIPKDLSAPKLINIDGKQFALGPTPRRKTAPPQAAYFIGKLTRLRIEAFTIKQLVGK